MWCHVAAVAQVIKKSEYMKNKVKSQQTFAARRAAGPGVSGKTWLKPAVAVHVQDAAAAGQAVKGEPESPASLGDMGLAE